MHCNCQHQRPQLCLLYTAWQPASQPTNRKSAVCFSVPIGSRLVGCEQCGRCIYATFISLNIDLWSMTGQLQRMLINERLSWLLENTSTQYISKVLQKDKFSSTPWSNCLHSIVYFFKAWWQSFTRCFTLLGKLKILFNFSDKVDRKHTPEVGLLLCNRYGADCVTWCRL